MVKRAKTVPRRLARELCRIVHVRVQVIDTLEIIAKFLPRVQRAATVKHAKTVERPQVPAFWQIVHANVRMDGRVQIAKLQRLVQVERMAKVARMVVNHQVYLLLAHANACLGILAQIVKLRWLALLGATGNNAKTAGTLSARVPRQIVGVHARLDIQGKIAKHSIHALPRQTTRNGQSEGALLRARPPQHQSLHLVLKPWRLDG